MQLTLEQLNMHSKWQEAYQAGVSDTEARYKPKAFKDELPQEGEFVLMTTTEGDAAVVRFENMNVYKSQTIYEWWNNDNEEYTHFTHWQDFCLPKL